MQEESMQWSNGGTFSVSTYKLAMDWLTSTDTGLKI